MLKILGTLLALYVLILIAAATLQRHLIYFPAANLPSPASVFVPQMQVIELHTADKLTLHAWYAPASPGKASVLYLHGNAGNIANRAAIVRPYIESGLGVLLLEYRGYGGNPGTPSEDGLYADALSAWDFLAQSVPAHCILIVGESLGSAPAIHLAALHPPAALVLMAPFPSLAAVGAHHYFFLPIPLVIRDGYYMQDKIKKIQVPLLVFMGNQDSVVPPRFTQELYNLANAPKELINYEGAGHNDLFFKATPRILMFVQEKIHCGKITS